MMEINFYTHILNMFKKLIFNQDLNQMLGDFVEIIENIDFFHKKHIYACTYIFFYGFIR